MHKTTLLVTSLLLAQVPLCAEEGGVFGRFLKKTTSALSGEPAQEAAAAKPNETATPADFDPAVYEAVTIEAIATEFYTNSGNAIKKWEKRATVVGGFIYKPGKPIKFTAEVTSTEQDTNHGFNRRMGKPTVGAPAILLNFQQKASTPSVTRSHFHATGYLGKDEQGWASRYNRGDQVTVYGNVLSISDRSISVLVTHIASAPVEVANPQAPNLDLQVKLQQKVTRKEVKRVPLAERTALNEALLQAAQSNDWDTVIEALEAGANPNMAQPSSQSNVLGLYSRQADTVTPKERLDYSRKLLEYGVSATGGYSSWPLVRAVERNEYDLVLLLLQNGANPNEKIMFGRPSIMESAARHNNKALVELLQAAAKRE